MNAGMLSNVSWIAANDQTLYRRIVAVWGVALIAGVAVLLWTLPWHHRPPWAVIAIVALASLSEILWTYRLRQLSR